MKIEACPFCGSTTAPVVCSEAEADGIEEGDAAYSCASSRYIVVCDFHKGGCGASSGGSITPNTPEMAIKKWNRRTQPHGNI